MVLLGVIGIATFVAFAVDAVNNLLAVVVILGMPASIIYCCYIHFLRRSPLLLNHGLDDHVVRAIGGGFCPAVICAVAVELVLTVIFVLMFMGDEIKKLTEEAEQEADGDKPADNSGSGDPADISTGSLSLGGIVFLLCTSFITAALVEEALKMAIVRWQCLPDSNACCVQPRPRHARSTFALLLSSALAFSTIENFGYVLMAPLGGVGVKLVASLGRAFLSLPLHVVATSFTASRLGLFDLEAASGA